MARGFPPKIWHGTCCNHEIPSTKSGMASAYPKLFENTAKCWIKQDKTPNLNDVPKWQLLILHPVKMSDSRLESRYYELWDRSEELLLKTHSLIEKATPSFLGPEHVLSYNNDCLVNLQLDLTSVPNQSSLATIQLLQLFLVGAKRRSTRPLLELRSSVVCLILW